MQVVILAGGAGTRMGELARDVPKPMIPIAGRPILAHQLEWVRRAGLRDVLLLTGHKGDAIREHFGDGRELGLSLRYHRESSPLGTAGAVREVADQLRDDFLVLYGDTIFDIDLAHLAAHHQRHKSAATLLVHPNDHPHDSDLVDIDNDDRITAFHRKPRPNDQYYRNLVSAALYVMSPRLLERVEPGAFADFGRDVFPNLVARGETLTAYNTTQYIKDVGTPHRLREVERDIESGRVARFNRRHKRPAIFFDRDGVLNVEREELIRRHEELQLHEGAAAAVRRANASDYLSVVVTNQPIIAKGFSTFDDLAMIHAKLDTLLGKEGAFVDRIYFCPHHPERGFAGERAEYKIECDCRKPATGMLTRAADELGIDLSRSFIIGDRTTDIECGRRAGLSTVMVRTGAAGRDGKVRVTPDHQCDNVSDAVTWILSQTKDTDVRTAATDMSQA